MLEDLVDLICRNTRVTCATTVLAPDSEDVNREYRLEECHCTPYAVAAFAAINKAILWIGAKKKNRRFTEFVFEQGDAGADGFDWLVNDIIRRRPSQLEAVRPRFEQKRLPPLQAADLSVWEQRNFVRKKQQGTLPTDFDALRPSFQRLAQQRLLPRPNDWGVLGRDAIAAWASRHVGVPKRSEPFERSAWRPFPPVTPIGDTA